METTTNYPTGSLIAVRLSVSGSRFQSEIKFIKRCGGQFESVSKLWVIKVHDGNRDALRLLAKPGVTLLSPDEYRAAYRAARA